MEKSLPVRSFLLVACALSWQAGCQVVAGVEDKQLDPALAGDAGIDAVVDAVSDEAATDSPEDAPPEANDAAQEAGPRYPPRPPERPDGGVPEASPDADADADTDADTDADAAGGGKTLTFATRRVFFGSIDPDSDVRTFEAWRQFGYDIDGFCTTSKQSQDDDSNVCKKPLGATALSQEDGFECRDNTVGHLLSDVLKFVPVDFERSLHKRTESGVSQMLILQLLDVGDGPDDPYVPARVYVAAPSKFPPLWNGSDVLPVDEESVVDQDLGQPKYVYEDGYIRNNMWVSGDFGVSPALVPMAIFDEFVEVNADTVTMSIQLDGANAKPLHGMISAVVDIEDMVPLLRRGVLEATDCNAALADMAIDSYFRPSQDLASGSPNFVNASASCDRQSMGLLFDLVTVLPPVEAVEVEPVPSVCP